MIRALRWLRTGLLRVAWITGLIALIALLVYSARSQIDPVIHDRYARDIREVAALDSQMNGEVMQSRQALVNHFDDIVETVGSVDALHKRLRDVPRFLARSDRAEIAALVVESIDLFRLKEETIETFKSENAVLRNSVRFFPVGALELRDRLEGTPDSAGFSRYVNELLCTVLRFNALPSETLRESANANLASLSGDTRPANAKEDLDIVLTHARTVLDRRDRVDELTNQIVAMPTAGRVDAIDAVYARAFQSALRSSEQRRIASFTLALVVLLLVSGDIIFHLRHVAKRERVVAEKLAAANIILQGEREREKELSELKSRFVSMTSHEFRTPLSVILSSTELLEAYGDRWTAVKRSDHYQRIKTAVSGMAELLDSVLVVGRADAGRLECKPATINLMRYCRELVDAMQPSVTDAHAFTWKAEGPLSEVVLDEKLLNHILTNLLSNAIKYSPEGGAVRFEVTCTEGTSSQVVFKVSDEGIGIPVDDQRRLYESFHRGRNVGEVAGTGLGLVVVKRAVEAHGGELNVESIEGKGTTFTVRLPTTIMGTDG